MLLSPLIVPHFTIGLGLLMLATGLSAGQGWPVLVLTHVIVVAALRDPLRLHLPAEHRRAAGARRRQPRGAAPRGAHHHHPAAPGAGLVSGWLFAAILSFNEFTASLFVTNQATQTLPVAMYGYVREFADPTLAAVSVIYIAVTAALLTLANNVPRVGQGAECRARPLK